MQIISNTYFVCTIFKKWKKPLVLIYRYKLWNSNLWGHVKINIMLFYTYTINGWMIIICAKLQITIDKDYVMAIFDNVENALKFHLTVFTDGRPHFVVKEHSASNCCYWHIIIFTLYSIKSCLPLFFIEII